MNAPAVRLRHRIPIPLRHHWRLLVVAVALVGLTLGGLSAYRVRPIVLAQGAEQKSSTVDIAGTVDLFDPTVAHTLELTFPQDAYDRMVATYQSEDDKQYVEADLTIDGTALPSVGIRLKGNSTLRALGGAGGAGGGFRPGGTSMSFQQPEELPWLISIDHFVDGRRYQGRQQLALRPTAQTGSTLNEALALRLVGLAGEPTQQATYTALRMNDRPATTRLLIEVPDKEYADELGHGVLYKSLAMSSFSFQGEDPTAYADDFDQINRKGSQDLQPVIDLIQWATTATDAEFAAELDDRLDVASFARYVALQNLLLNFDDMAGPGRNYYLFYELDEHRFQVITWDLNLALSGDTNRGPFDAGTMGGLRPGGNAGNFGNGGAGGPVVAGPGGGPGIVGGPGGAGAPGGNAGGPGGGAVRGGPMGGNTLKERFLAATAFREVYLDAYRQLYQTLFAGGVAERELDATVAAARRSGASIADAQVSTLRATITARATALANNADVSN